MSNNDQTVYDGGTTLPDEMTKLRNVDLTDAGAATEDCATAPEKDAVVPQEDVIIEKGAALLDTYQVESDAIQGGMGKVWRVRHTGWNVNLALKQPKSELFQNERQKADFIHECEAWINLGLHPQIVSCYYVREMGGVPSIFSEWMEGGSLKDWIASGKLYEGGARAALERVLDVAIQFGRGLHYAHEQGLIHQDVKPDNLLLTTEGEAKVADFGIARARAVARVQGANSGLPDNATMMSDSGAYTPAYCSMEQLNGKVLTRRTDIYSWAVSVLEMFLGERLWQSGVVAGVACEDYFAMDMRIPMPEDLKNLLRQCLDENPENRPHDFSEADAVLVRIYQDETGGAYPREMSKAAADTADSLNNRALSFLDLGKPKEAKRCWEQAIWTDPNHSVSAYNRAVFQWKRSEIDADEAMRYVRMNFENHMGDSHSSLLAGKLSLMRGDAYGAGEYFKRTADADLEEAQALLKDTGQNRARQGYELCVIRNYRDQAAIERRFEEKEREIRALIENGNISDAMARYNATMGEGELNSFMHSPSGMLLNTELSRFGTMFFVAAAWPVRRICKTFGAYLSFTPDDQYIFTDDALHLLDGEGEKFRYQWGEKAPVKIRQKFLGGELVPDHGHSVCSSMSPDGRTFLRVARGESVFREFTAATAHFMRSYEGHTRAVCCMVYSADGKRVLSGSADGTVCLWDVQRKEPLLTLHNRDGEVRKVALHYDGRLAAVMGDTSVHIWDLHKKCRLHSFSRQEALLDFCVDVAFERVVCACGDEGLVSYSVKDGTRHTHRAVNQTAEKRQNPHARCVCFLPCEQYILSGAGDLLYFWDLRNNRLMNMIPCGGTIFYIAASQDGRMIAVMTRRGAELWRCAYHYQFAGWSDTVPESAKPYIDAFLAGCQGHSGEGLPDALLEELQNRGFGYVSEQSVKEWLDSLHLPSPEPETALASSDKVEPLTLFDRDFKIHEGLLFGYTPGARQISIPRGVTSIGKRVFEGDEVLCRVQLPEGLEVIEERAFYRCAALSQVTLPTTLKRIGSKAFGGCPAFQMQDIPPGVIVEE